MIAKLSGRNLSSYATTTGWSWDGKPRGDQIIAKRIESEWVLSGEVTMVMVGDKPPVVPFYVNDWFVTTTPKSAKLTVGKRQAIMIPWESVRSATYDGKVYEVLQILSFLKVAVNGVVRTLIGCFGYCEMYREGVFVAVGPDDPMLVGVPFSMIHERDAFGGEEDSDARYAAYSPPVNVTEEGNEIGAQLTILHREQSSVAESGDTAAAKAIGEKMDVLWEKLEALAETSNKVVGRIDAIEASALLKDVNPPAPEEKRVKFGSFGEKPSPSEERARYCEEALAMARETLEKSDPKLKVTTEDGVKTVHVKLHVKEEKKEKVEGKKPIKIRSAKFVSLT